MRDLLRGWIVVGAAMLALASAGGCKRVSPPEPLGQLNKQQMRGYTAFATRCAACHYDRKDAALHGPALINVFKKPYLPSGAPANDERVTATIVHGRGLMPAMGNQLDEQDVQDLLAYLHTL